MTFHDVVSKVRYTSINQPMSVDGELEDGRYYFFHFNHGYATLGIGETRMGAIQEGMFRGKNVTSDLPGWLRDEQFREVFMELYALYSEEDTDTVPT